MTRLASLPALLLVASLTACGDPTTSSTGGTDLGMQGSDLGSMPDLASPPDLAPAGTPISAPKATWTWVPIEGAVCDDGTPTGIGVYLTDSPNLLVFLNGGGACWDYLTCGILKTSTTGPFGQAQFDAQAKVLAGNNDTVFSEADGASFKGWNKVYVPYCTGDIHGGDIVQTYKSSNAMVTKYHKGFSNVKLALARLGATLPSPATLVWSGSSAGGFGSAVTYVTARSVWPAAKSFLIDDSGPVFVGDSFPASYKPVWGESWNLDVSLFAFCPECKTGGDWSSAYTKVSKMFPNDRLSLLTTEEDITISTYFQQDAASFKSHVYELASKVFDPASNMRYFIQTGSTHTMLGDESKHTTGGVNVADFIKAQVTGDASWKSIKP